MSTATLARAASDPLLYGLMAEFQTADELVEAARVTTEAGYRYYDCYTPFPIEELHEVMPHKRNWLPALVLIAGILGGLGGFALCYWTSVIDYPINVAGKPLNSWPAFIPVTFECTILAAALTAVFGMLGLNGFPMPYHPVFNVSRFALASRDRFFLCIESRDPLFDVDETWSFLSRLHPRQVSLVEQ
ncbi:MAG: DUF3341 domain-containing protein [Candidatus Binatia bacterium]